MNSINIAVIGAGGWGKNHVRTVHNAKRAHLRMVCDQSQDTLNQLAEQYTDTQFTTDYQTVLENKDIDAVLIATPSPTHYQLSKLALQANKHVFVEKPMTQSVAEATELVDLAKSVNKKLMVGHLLEYHPAVECMKDQIQQGTLGKIYYLYSKRLNLGVVRLQENAMWSLMPHDISVALFVLDAYPVLVQAVGQSYLNPGVEDVVFVNLEFPGNVMAQIHVSWLDPHKERKTVLVGSDKMIVFDDMSPTEKVKVYDKGASVNYGGTDMVQSITVRHGDIHSLMIPNHEPLLKEVQHFVDCILEDKTPQSDGIDGLNVVSVLEAATKSLQQGNIPISLDSFVS